MAKSFKKADDEANEIRQRFREVLERIELLRKEIKLFIAMYGDILKDYSTKEANKRRNANNKKTDENLKSKNEE